MKYCTEGEKDPLTINYRKVQQRVQRRNETAVRKI